MFDRYVQFKNYIIIQLLIRLIETVRLGVVTQTTIVKGPPGEQKKIIHETVKFDCEVLYDPTYDLTVEWRKDNDNVDEDDPRFTVDRASIGNQALTITDLTYADAGKTLKNLLTYVGVGNCSGIKDYAILLSLLRYLIE